MYYLYILESSKTGSYYIGTTQNLDERLARHNRGGSAYTRRDLPWRRIYSEEFTIRSEATKREKQLKGWKNRTRIEALVGKSLRSS